MSIRFRLNALMVTLLTLALVSFVGAMIIEAGPRIRAENESISRLSKEFVETAVESLQGTTNPGARLAVLLDGLKNLRHVHIYFANDPKAAAQAQAESEQEEGWLPRLAQPTAVQHVPVFVNGRSFGDLVIAPKAADEAAEIWESILTLTIIGSAVTTIMLALMSLTIAHLLRPIRTVGSALLALDSGQYDVAVKESGPPEIADICRKLNRLASTLKTTISENRRLAKRIIRIQDEERKDLARDLHDELGPYLFAIRAGATTIRSEVERGSVDKPKLVDACQTLLDRIETMQDTNRRVLQKLRPMGLEELGLTAKLGSLVAMARDAHPAVSIELDVSHDIPDRDETGNLTIFRIVQEGLTNALRHADATQIDINITPARHNDEAQRTGRIGQGRASVYVTISDNGRGMAEEVRPSYGITGMSERVWAIGGEMRISSGQAGGVTLEAWVPATAGEGQSRPENHPIST
jgi:two-component system, NarL family, sensor histidine kinase UhpB